MPRKKQWNREDVLEKAKDLFWKQGFHATTVSDLIEHLGMNKAGLYKTFGGKNQLYETALQAYRDENGIFLNQDPRPDTSAYDDLKTFFLSAVQNGLEDPDKKGCFVVNCTTEYLPLHPHILPKLTENRTTVENYFLRIIQKGIDREEFSSDMNQQETASYLFTFLSGLRVIGKIEDNPQRLLRTVEVGLEALKVK